MNDNVILMNNIKENTECILQGLEKEKLSKESLLYHHISLIEKEKHLLSFKLDYFMKLMFKYCYNEKPDQLNYEKPYVPKENLELFEKVFLVKHNITKDMYSISYIGTTEYIHSKEELYYRLFYKIFIEYIITEKNIEIIFNEFLDQWNLALKTNEMPIKIEVILPDVFAEDVNINSNLEIKSYYDYTYFDQKGERSIALGNIGTFLIYKTKIDFNHNFFISTQKNKKELENKWLQNLKPVNEFILSLNLQGIDFIWKYYEIKFPWWVFPREKKYRTPKRSLGRKKIPINIIETTKKLFNLIKEIDFLNDKEMEIILHRYFQIVSRKYLQDSILDEFIILESIFTTSNKTEITFRLSLNLAFFLSESKGDLIKIFEAIKAFYSIRSKIAHGEDWIKGMKKEKILKHISTKKDDFNTIAMEIFKKLKYFIDLTLVKIIKMKKELRDQELSTKILDKFKGIYIITNSKLLID